ncbi:hypothetical protein [Kordiimonas laminariae]|uniref:hypothetical protein n=1 Tax=Kordiimonas laminariae TaxID=2917717 RepID=UPI001FF649E3|nr:hypothetical protein [Kordiimonas laminariae]MCK0067999.1 hypothetical protein [Kordiimonas laminariae]
MTDMALQKELLREKITQVEVTLANLQDRFEMLEEEEQHNMIDHLEDYIDEVHTEAYGLKEYWTALKTEI